DGTSSTARDSFRFDDCIEASLVRKNKSLRKDPRMCLNYLSGNGAKIKNIRVSEKILHLSGSRSRDL
ncbi:MAG: hypothetical protein ACREU6_01215, partial [Steroidobacteraceae bacterium]